MSRILVALALTICLLSNATAQPVADPFKAGFDPHPGATVPLDLTFVDHTGARATLRQLLGGKPALLVLGYYHCPMLCHEVQQGLLDGLRSLDEPVGDGFRVITVSIDPAETPDLAAEKRRSYLEAYGRSMPADAWPFLVGDAGSVTALQTAVGFRSARLEDQIAHPAGLVVLTADGRVSSYLTGIRFPATAISEALKAARASQTRTLVQSVLLLCYQYDPATGRYSLAIYRMVQLLAALTVAILTLSVAGWLRAERRRRAAG